ncbi:V-type ATP synthase subunit C [Thermoclostridium stercorarium subsp. stercorarium DSM 8532]|jgi:V/A-type H+-transporting ATPase subunit K|uniref:V-type ATP synthase subunit C n=3 Tax=Thermoclostridium stercorarium TaxID=1510 RepID=L7VSR1_THES1|nr:ATP synthase subunit C [Thermoclostridium stercorarium]AGC69416.1 V-type ATP synthase subunit C [Thermoclostridium stercorarium subsp. stercorarium DSM 8532]AGI40374.1 ATP synthase subunit C [Thermoclostridium stercorarium subsp. stercorarium DSM 8532]ANW99665.1 ATPase [Thermoclostridium stercorarium subsp. thermolacticum DSM 2910]ANX02291.1 ATPase [Thermoclostridium stercorarium subsp. leptospartum DSM 9219]UZQ85370.1 ATP synthase subunit C [Thermoclostridium stercorarium]
MIYILAVSILLVLGMIILGIVCIKRGLKGKNARRLMGINITALFGLLIVATILLMPISANAAPEDAAGGNGEGLRYIAAALSTGLACIGAGIAVASTGSAALGAISEDSGLLGKTLIFVGLAEGIAIYGLIVTILILNS